MPRPGPADEGAMPAWAPATQVVAGGRPPHGPGAATSTGVAFTSTYGAGGPVDYARAGNPTWSAFEETLGGLEGGDCLLFASGLAAVSATLRLVRTGSTIVAPTAGYSGVVSILADAAACGDLNVRWVDVTDSDEVVAALPGADLLWLESPTNPLLGLADIERLTGAAHAVGAIVVCDNTFATPIYQRPLELGVDVAVHSVTKYLSGHSDLLLGATVTPTTTQGVAHREELARVRLLGGAIAGPMEAWLALRGLRTLSVRLDRASRNAAILAARLAAHRAVSRVRFPGFGAMVSIEVVGGGDAADRACAASRLVSHSTSLGGVESQWERRRRHANEPATTPENLIRISVGIEDVEDLWRDLDSALAAAHDDDQSR